MIKTLDLPLVSVIIPTYNRSYSLAATIKGVLKQSYKNIEIIIVDDGSTDNTKNLVSSFGSKIIYIQKPHTGQADTRNVGLQFSKGQIIAPLDSDDIWNDNYLEKSILYMLENNLDMFFSNWEYNTVDIFKDNIFPFFIDNIEISNNGCYIFDYAEFRKFLLIDSIAPSSGLILKKSSIHFGWNSQVNIGDDWVLQLELIFKNLNCRVGFTNEVFWKKYRDATNISDGRKGIQFRRLHINDLYLILNNFSSYLDKSEQDMIYLKVIQNKILISHLLLLKGNVGIEMKQLLIYIIKKPLLLFSAFNKGVHKIITRKYQFILTKYL